MVDEGTPYTCSHASALIGSNESTEQNLKDSLRAGIATGIAIATLLKALKVKDQSTDEDLLPMVKVDLTQELSAEGQGGYHPFWVVPKIVDRTK
jgi:hypothetical protein